MTTRRFHLSPSFRPIATLASATLAMFTLTSQPLSSAMLPSLQYAAVLPT